MTSAAAPTPLSCTCHDRMPLRLLPPRFCGPTTSFPDARRIFPSISSPSRSSLPRPMATLPTSPLLQKEAASAAAPPKSQVCMKIDPGFRIGIYRVALFVDIKSYFWECVLAVITDSFCRLLNVWRVSRPRSSPR